MENQSQPGWAMYKDQLDFLGFGDALWEPTPPRDSTRVRVGDVGFLRRGRFHILFSASDPLGDRKLGEDVPPTFEQLEVGTTEYTLAREAGCLSTSSVRRVETKPDDATSSGTEPSFSFELTENRGAGLVTKYETYRADTKDQSPFEEYTKRHYESWVVFGREKGYADDVRPILVTGFDVTRDFEMITYSDEESTSTLESELVSAGPNLGPASASLWVTRRTSCSPHTNQGPWGSNPLPSDRTIDFPSKSTKEEDIPAEFNQCIFIRYCTMRMHQPSPELPNENEPSGDPENPKVIERQTLHVIMQPDGELIICDDMEFEGEWSCVADDDGNEIGVVHNVPSDKDYDSWDIIADYVFKNSDAASVLFHHRDLVGIRGVENADGIAALLEKHKPSVVVDANGVGRIVSQETKQPEKALE